MMIPHIVLTGRKMEDGRSDYTARPRTYVPYLVQYGILCTVWYFRYRTQLISSSLETQNSPATPLAALTKILRKAPRSLASNRSHVSQSFGLVEFSLGPKTCEWVIGYSRMEKDVLLFLISYPLYQDTS